MPNQEQVQDQMFDRLPMTVSEFEEDYVEWRGMGFTHFEALNKARDEYRVRRRFVDIDYFSGKFDRRFVITSEHITQRLEFNETLSRLLTAINEIKVSSDGQTIQNRQRIKLRRMVLGFIIMQNLIYEVDPEVLELFCLKDEEWKEALNFDIRTAQDLQVFVGFKRRPTGLSDAFIKLRNIVQDITNDLVKEGGKLWAL